MIKLIAEPKPSELTNEVVEQLTKKYKKNNKISVWRDELVNDGIRKTLLKMSHGKCCYCECEVNIEGSDLHVEHFYLKSLYQDLVVMWCNLLPACTRCNRKKGTLDIQRNPLIHPVNDNPKNHLTVKNFYFFGKDNDELGEFTIERLQLNDDERLSVARFRLGHGVISQLDDLTKELLKILSNNTSLTIKEESSFTRKLQKIMLFGTATKKYSAVIGNVILHDNNYAEMKQQFINHNLWSDEFIQLEKQVQFCALDSK